MLSREYAAGYDGQDGYMWFAVWIGVWLGFFGCLEIKRERVARTEFSVVLRPPHVPFNLFLY